MLNGIFFYKGPLTNRKSSVIITIVHARVAESADAHV